MINKIHFFLKEISLRKSHTTKSIAQEAGIEIAMEVVEFPAKSEKEIFNKNCPFIIYSKF